MFSVLLVLCIFTLGLVPFIFNLVLVSLVYYPGIYDADFYMSFAIVAE